VSCTYSDSIHVHAVTALSDGSSYTYGANGNMVTRVEGGVTYQQVFDAENRLVSVTANGQTSTFVYPRRARGSPLCSDNSDGNRAKKTDPGGTTHYVGGIYEVNAGVVTKLHGDHLGSTSVTTDASGNVVAEQRYYPYGEVRWTNGTLPTDFQFTGQRHDSYTQLVEMGVRWYSPRLGRWTSPDSIIPGFANPQSLNRFMYVFGNVLRLIDPRGYDPELVLNGTGWTLDELVEENARWLNDPSSMADKANRRSWIRQSIGRYHGEGAPVLLLAMVAIESNGEFSNAESDLGGYVHGAMGVSPGTVDDPNPYYHGPYVNTPASLEQNIRDGCGVYNEGSTRIR
jgi:RHS repeat-associated protein